MDFTIFYTDLWSIFSYLQIAQTSKIKNLLWHYALFNEKEQRKKYTWKSKSKSTWHQWDLIEISMSTISKFKLKFINWNRQFHFSYSYHRGISLRSTNHFCLNFRCIFFSKSFRNISNCIFVDVLCVWKRKNKICYLALTVRLAL